MLTVVSCFASKDYALYGKNFVETFNKNWPEDVKLILYLESADNEVYHDVEAFLEGKKRREFSLSPLSSIPLLTNAIATYSHYPKMNGTLHGEYSMRWDGVKFCYKVFSFCQAALHQNRDRYLLWLDADTVTHSPIPTAETITNLINQGDVVSWLNRDGNYPECGFLLFDTHHHHFIDVITNMLLYYVKGKILELEQTHDSWVWWQVIEKDLCLPITNLSGEFSAYSHPFVNVLGKWLDHLKGPRRKEEGRSLAKDIKSTRNEKHWHGIA